MGKGFESRIFLLACAVLALLVAAAAAQALAAQSPAPCLNGVQDSGESGVDCGGGCASASMVDYCDGLDNDNDCAVDEDCSQKKGYVTEPIIKASCSDGLRNQDELQEDCGGVCSSSAKEVCDGLDNDNNCLIDDADECREATTPPAPSVPPITPESAPEPVPQSVSSESSAAPVESSSMPASPPDASPASKSASAASEVEPASVPAVPVAESELGSFVEEAEQIRWLRKFAKDNGAYIPDEEPDAELLNKYMAFTKKHEAELSAKFEGKGPTEDELAGILKQFSDETYPRPEQKPQSQSLFSKVKGFFKRLFG